MYRRIAVCSATLALLPLGLAASTASATATTTSVCHTKTYTATTDSSATPTTTSITTCDDTFNQASGTYMSIYAGTTTHALPLMKNDPAKSMSGMQICRLDRFPPQSNNPLDWGSSNLTNGQIIMKINSFTRATVTQTYALCNDDFVSAPTTFTVVVKRLYAVKAKLNRARTKLLVGRNRNAATLSCEVYNRENAKFFKVSGHASGKKVRLPAGPKHGKWSCLIKQPLGVAVAGKGSWG